jgi:predicted house-cleaning NTP pyrophosphatase (Maf/HAM1 superfamily)
VKWSVHQRDLTTEQSQVRRIYTYTRVVVIVKCVETLLVEIFGYDVWDKGKHFIENIRSRLTGSLGMSLWTWAQWLDRTGVKANEASFELHGMGRRKGMVYS